MADVQSSLSNTPDFPGQQDFHGEIIHLIDFGQSDAVQNKSIQRTALLGAGETAADMVYEAAEAGKTVSWIIRGTGNGSLGAAAFAPIGLVTPYKDEVEAPQARSMASSTCYLIHGRSWWTRFLERGATFVRKIFSLLDNMVRKCAGHRERESDKGFGMLEHGNAIFWKSGTPGGHFADLRSPVAEKVQVYHDDEELLSGDDLYLDDENGTHFPCDAVLCGTGWQCELQMLDDSTLMEPGVPDPEDMEPQAVTETWEALVGEAEEHIKQSYTSVRQPPVRLPESLEQLAQSIRQVCQVDR